MATILPAYVASALAASQIGTWRCSMTGERLWCDERFAAIFGLDPSAVREGISFARVQAKISPEDRHLFIRKGDAVRERGGHVVMEYRVHPYPGVERWVLVRGRYEAHGGADDRECVGLGIAIDVTDVKRASGSAEPIYLVSSDPGVEPELTPLQTAVTTALTLHHQIARLAPSQPSLEALSEMTLLLLGRRLAREVDPSDLLL